MNAAPADNPLPASGPTATPGDALSPGVPASAFRVLLVDDNADANESMATLLELIGYPVACAGDGASALEKALAFQPHLVLSDIGLPGMSGHELAGKLRAQHAGRKLILAAATGYGHETDRMRSRAAGFDHHLVKPIDADTLLDFLAQQAAAY